MSQTSKADTPNSAVEPQASRSKVLAWNAFANVLRAGSTSLVSMLLPILLVFLMPTQNYAVWALVFGIASYALYLDLGLQSTVQALVGRFDGAHEERSAALVGRSAMNVIGIVIGLCLAFGVTFAILLPNAFPDIPPALRFEGQLTLVFVLLGQVSSLAGSVMASYFAGRQRSMEATAFIAPSRLLSMGGAVIAAGFSAGLLPIAIAYSVPLFIGTILLLWKFSRETKALRRMKGNRHVESTPWYLLVYSGPLIIWNLCMMIVTGLGIVLVGRFDYQMVTAYAVSATIVAGISGIDNALLQPLLPELARRHNRGASRADLASIVLFGSQLNGAFLACVSIGLLAFGPLLLGIILGANANSEAFAIYGLLAVGSSLRLLTAPLSLAFVATKTHSRVILPPIVEAVINLACSVMLGMTFGAVGVAMGYFAGALVCLVLTTTWSLRISGAIETKSSAILFVSLVKPLMCVAPAIAAIALVHILGVSDELSGYALASVGILVSAPLVWQFALPAVARKRILTRVLKSRA